MKPDNEPALTTCRTRADLTARLAKIDPKKIEAYNKFRSTRADNPWQSSYYEYNLWSRSHRAPPFEPDPLAPRRFAYRTTMDLAPHTPDWGHPVRWVQDEFEIRAEVVPDDSYADLTYLGEICRDDPGDGAIPMEKYSAEGKPRFWYTPAFDLEENLAYLREHFPRHEAWLRCLEIQRYNYRRLKSFGEDWSNVGVRVTVYYNDIEFAQGAAWGIESDNRTGFYGEVAADLASELVAQARTRLALIREDKAESSGRVIKTYLVEKFAAVLSGFEFDPREVYYAMPLAEHRDGVRVLITRFSANSKLSVGRQCTFSKEDWEITKLHVTIDVGTAEAA